MSGQNKKLLFIGEVEAQSGIPIRTIRYYETLGLLKSSGRSEGGFRQFSPEVFARLEFIKRAQSLGFSLQEIGEILQVYERGNPPCAEIKDKLEDKVLDIDYQIKQLLTLRVELRRLLSGWKNLPSLQEGTVCPIIQRKPQEELNQDFSTLQFHADFAPNYVDIRPRRCC